MTDLAIQLGASTKKPLPPWAKFIAMGLMGIFLLGAFFERRRRRVWPHRCPCGACYRSATWRNVPYRLVIDGKYHPLHVLPMGRRLWTCEKHGRRKLYKLGSPYYRKTLDVLSDGGST